MFLPSSPDVVRIQNMNKLVRDKIACRLYIQVTHIYIYIHIYIYHWAHVYHVLRFVILWPTNSDIRDDYINTQLSKAVHNNCVIVSYNKKYHCLEGIYTVVIWQWYNFTYKHPRWLLKQVGRSQIKYLDFLKEIIHINYETNETKYKG